MTPLYKAEILLAQCGFEPSIQSTGCPHWKRLFIRFQGVTYGRISSKDGKLSNFKWYCNTSGKHITHADYVYYRYHHAMETGKVLRYSIFEAAAKHALLIRCEDIQAKELERSKLPRVNSLNKPIKRRAIQGKSYHSFIKI